MTLKDLFGIKQGRVVNSDDAPIIDKKDVKTFFEMGKDLSNALDGDPNSFQPALHKAYLNAKEIVEENEAEQQKRKTQLEGKIAIEEGNLAQLNNTLADIERELKHEGDKIDANNRRISEIHQNPSIVNGTGTNPKPSFIMGTLILVILTIYLFTFYSSAAYSAFFKEFNPSDNEFKMEHIFDASAISNASQEGFMAIVLIIAIPAVFLGLGFLIHQFNSNKQDKLRYLKSGSLIAVTFIFDTILAYQITSKIELIKKMASFNSENIPDYDLKMAFTNNIDFWTIIFAGFVVYLIWGLVYSFTMENYHKLDRVGIAIRELGQDNARLKIICNGLNNDKLSVQNDISNKKAEINKMRLECTEPIVLKADVELEINNFTTGWISYMAFKGMPQLEKDRVITIKNNLINNIKTHV